MGCGKDKTKLVPDGPLWPSLSFGCWFFEWSRRLTRQLLPHGAARDTEPASGPGLVTMGGLDGMGEQPPVHLLDHAGSRVADFAGTGQGQKPER